jgi:tripartite-type tricarboxylate transporter receptor subunit TctC
MARRFRFAGAVGWCLGVSFAVCFDNSFDCVFDYSLGLGPRAAHSQTYPSKAITMVVPAAPGGVTDILARTLGQKLTEAWGQQIIVENKPGATNQIAAEYVAAAAPDGYTLLVSPEATFVVNPRLFNNLRYDADKDFTPISGLVSIHQALVVSPSLPVESVTDFIALAKNKPGEINYGTFGAGSTGHLNMEMLQTMAGIKLNAVHYKGATPALTDVMAGHIQAMFISVGSAVEPAKAGKVKLLATGGAQRLAQLPDVPTIAENGLPGFEAVSWFGIFAPKGTANERVAKLNHEVSRVLSDPDVRRNFLDRQFFQPMTGSPDEFAGFIKVDAGKWSEVLRAAQVKIE